MTREVEDRLRTGEQLAFRGETHGQKEQIITELVKVHQQFLSRINQTKSFLHSTINYLKNTSKLETQIHNDRRKFSSLPNDIRTTELLLRQFEGEREKIVEIFNQTRHDFNSLEQKAFQVGENFPEKKRKFPFHFQCGATSIFDEIKAKQNEIDSKFSAWQRNDEENRSTLNQRVEWCQFVDEKYKVAFPRNEKRLSIISFHFVFIEDCFRTRRSSTRNRQTKTNDSSKCSTSNGSIRSDARNLSTFRRSFARNSK